MIAVLSVGAASAQNWAVGGRVGTGIAAVGQYVMPSENYVEARLGLSILSGTQFDLSGLYTWNIKNMDWTSEGVWFFDAGVGVNLGAGANPGLGRNYFHIGPQGMAKLGYEFEGAPVRLSLDWSPVIGVGNDGFYGPGLAGFGITCVYRF